MARLWIEMGRWCGKRMCQRIHTRKNYWVHIRIKTHVLI
ncbi:hypothetical protein Golob_026463 [Gossypium lobatum]|uniref:Uncharacterized protein n=1 Tax=Gossypium lobatum TaxID=34289 RepID=A0A7J8LV73_9ROSI|nr:hypothetical protein [Gossypium lobatum]